MRNGVGENHMERKDPNNPNYMSEFSSPILSSSSSSSSSSDSNSKQRISPLQQQQEQEEDNIQVVDEEDDDDEEEAIEEMKKMSTCKRGDDSPLAQARSHNAETMLKAEEDTCSTTASGCINKMSPSYSSIHNSSSSSVSSSSSSTSSSSFRYSFSLKTSSSNEETQKEPGKKAIKHSIHSILGLNGVTDVNSSDEFEQQVKRKPSSSSSDFSKKLRKL